MKNYLLLIVLLLSTQIYSQVVLDESFNGTTLPLGWTTENINTDGFSSLVWGMATGGYAPGYQPNNNQHLYSSGKLSGNYPVVYSYNFNEDGDYVHPGPINSTLTSPSFDCSGKSNLKLSFNHFFVSDVFSLSDITIPATGYVEVSNDNGTNWIIVQTYGPSDLEYGPVIIDISTQLSNVANAKVRFRYEGEASWYWAVDNVKVQQPTIDQPDAVTSVRNGIGNNTPVIVYRQASTNSLRKLVSINYDAPTTGSEIDGYDLVLSLNPDGSDPFLTIPNYNGTQDNMGVLLGQQGDLVEGWLPNTTYYWYVNSKNIAGTTSSEIFSFTTEANSGNPASLINYNPANNAIDVPISIDNDNNKLIVFSYENTNENSTIHQFLLGENPVSLDGGSGIFTYGNAISLSNTWAENTTYFYKMITYSAWGVTEGETIIFTTGTEESLSFTENPFDTFTMAPNPASNFVTINEGNKLDLITIYNKIGQKVKEVRKNELFNNTIDITNLPKGLYLFKLDFRNQSKTYKLIKK